MRVLLIEDEVRLSQNLAICLQKALFGVDAVYTRQEGLKYAQSGVYDAIILDTSLQGLDGLSVLQALREAKDSVPVLLLSAKGDVADIVKGLDAGADDYMAKPPSEEEFLARVRALTRRKGQFRETSVVFGDLALNKTNCELQKVGGESVKLSLKEFQIIDMLFENPRQIIRKERIIEKIWGGDSDAEYNNVEVYISFLRKKLERLNVRTTVRTARGMGYSLEEGMAGTAAAG